MGGLDALSAATEAHFGAAPRSVQRLHGGDLSDVFRLALPDGTQLVAKQGRRVAAEARMLRAIADAGAPAPAVLGQSGDILFLEHLPETAPTPATWAALGAGLRRLHDTTSDTYGWPEDYAFGPVTIPNRPSADWPSFWLENRLLAAPESLPGEIRHRLESLAPRLPDLMPHAPPPALLHGDLWSGNALFTPRAAYLIDPASYHGDAEVDLAMLHLFGAPPPAFYDGYGPTAPDIAARRPLYQLWPALVHLRLFGAGYGSMVTSRLSALGA